MFDVEDSDISTSMNDGEVSNHVKALQRLQEKDPEFYQFLKENDQELLGFGDEDDNDDEAVDTDLEDNIESRQSVEKSRQSMEKSGAVGKSKKQTEKTEKAVTTEMVDSWCRAIKKGGNIIGPVRCMLQAFRLACHYGDDGADGEAPKFNVISSSVFNKIMVFVLNEMDGILRKVLEAPESGGKKESIMALINTPAWKKHGKLMLVYLANALHILTQMTDEQMISFTLKRVKASAVFLAAFPTILRKYIKVVLHTWGTGRGALPVISFLFLRDLSIKLGPDCLETSLKGVYKGYVMNCRLSKNVSISKQQHIQFLANCVTELYGVDTSSAFQHVFISIRQLAMILRGALTERGNKVPNGKQNKKAEEGTKSSKKQLEKPYQKVYDWQFIYCLELWTNVVCTYSSESDFLPLAYPLTQIISGVLTLVPTARFFPLRVRCVKMLNRLALATGTYIPVSLYLLDMLDMKELRVRSTGGFGKALNFQCTKQVDKTTVKTRAFQDACTYVIVEEIANHLAQWSYSPAFFELSFVSLVRLKNFCKFTQADRCRREIRELIRHVEASSQLTNSTRAIADLSPNDVAVENFMQAEKDSGSSPLSKFAVELRLRAKQMSDSLVESSVYVGERSSVFGSKFPEIKAEENNEEYEEEANAVFSSDWLPEIKLKVPKEEHEEAPKQDASKKRSHTSYENEGEEDIVEDLVFSSSDDEDVEMQNMNIDSASEDEESINQNSKYKRSNKKQKVDGSHTHKKNNESSVKKASKRKRPERNNKKGFRNKSKTKK